MIRSLVLRRTLGAAVTFIAASTVVFAVTVALPGDPARAVAGRGQVSEATLRSIRQRYRMDEPLLVQYVHWFRRLFRGDLGESYVYRRPVSDVLLEALPVTSKLLVATVVIECALGVLIGAAAGNRSGGRFDGCVVAACTAALAVPPFVVGSIGQDLLGVRWHVLPVAGTGDGLLSYVMPSVTLALAGTALGVRLVRSQTLIHRHAPHVRTAYGKGLRSGTVTRRHVLRLALVPYVSFVGLEVGVLAGGSIVVERLFNLPGVGRAVARAISQRDNSLIIGFAMAVIVVYLVVDLLADVVALLLDPRLSHPDG